MDKSRVCCFTGHRPQKMKWGFDENHPECVAVKRNMIDSLRAAIDRGYDTFVCGMALGGDMYFAESVLLLKKEFLDIRLIGAIPCKWQDKAWIAPSKARYKRLCQKCEELIMVSSEEYFNGCMQKRNRYMVDNSSLLLCLYNGSSGGTRTTVQYAKKSGLQIINLLNES